MILRSTIILFLLTIALANNSNGTTSANFLEIDVGCRATSMGGAYVSLCEDPSAIFWNPSGLTHIERTETLFMYQPYWDDTNIIFVANDINFFQVVITISAFSEKNLQLFLEIETLAVV